MSEHKKHNTVLCGCEVIGFGDKAYTIVDYYCRDCKEFIGDIREKEEN